MPSWTKKGTIFSIPDAIAKIIEEHTRRDQTKLPFEEIYKKPAITKDTEIKQMLKNTNFIESPKPSTQFGNIEKPLQKKNSISSLADIGHAPECPECGGILEFGEGCLICRSCGYSKCG